MENLRSTEKSQAPELKVVTRNFKSSDFLNELAHRKLGSCLNKFPELRGHHLTLTLSDHTLEMLNRYGDRDRVKTRAVARKAKRGIKALDPDSLAG